MTEPVKKSKVTVEMDKDTAASAPKRGSLSRFEDIERDFEGLFDSFMSRNWLRPSRWDLPSFRGSPESRAPRVDVVERDDEVCVRAELPGVEKQDLEVSLTDRTVSIQATSRKEHKEEKGEYYRHEISTGRVSRTVTLPAEVDGQRATAEFKDGLLEITIPKTAAANRIRLDVK